MLDERLPSAVIGAQLRRILADGILTDAHPAAVVYDLAEVRRRCQRLRAAFPSSTLHTAAVKAVALPALLAEAGREGVGAEAASAGEIALAVAAGTQAAEIVFDSPCKTDAEIDDALRLGVAINADNLDELARLAGSVALARSSSVVGLRINPQVGAGSIIATSVAAPASKFGSPLTEAGDEIVDAFRTLPRLSMLHSHVGSQGTTLELLVGAGRRLVELAARIGWDRITHVDIGGGLPVSYRRGVPPTVAIETYATVLANECPELFDGRCRLITEFGRWLFAGAGWMVSRVENTKRAGGVSFATIHIGADLLLRAAYRPDEWSHELELFDPKGASSDRREIEPVTVVGPLCFSGDIVATDRRMPIVERGDHVVIRDTGAYTLSMVSRYNSRSIPPVIGIEADRCRVLRAAESTADLVEFWTG